MASSLQHRPAESTRIQRDHPLGMEITDPAWLWYECYFFPRLAFLNWRGITNPQYANDGPIGLLGELLDQYCGTNGVNMWRRQYVVVRNGPYLQGLRKLFRRLAVPVWLELASGYSRREYAGFDVFVRHFMFSLFVRHA